MVLSSDEEGDEVMLEVLKLLPIGNLLIPRLAGSYIPFSFNSSPMPGPSTIEVSVTVGLPDCGSAGLLAAL
jgi:hypothetical protein